MRSISWKSSLEVSFYRWMLRETPRIQQKLELSLVSGLPYHASMRTRHKLVRHTGATPLSENCLRQYEGCSISSSGDLPHSLNRAVTGTHAAPVAFAIRKRCDHKSSSVRA